MKFWQIRVSQAQSYISSIVRYWKLKIEFLDHFFVLFRLAVSDFWNKLPLIRCRGPCTKLRVFLSHIFSLFIFFKKYGKYRSSYFSWAYRAWKGLSNRIFYNFFELTLDYGRTSLVSSTTPIHADSLSFRDCDRVRSRCPRRFLFQLIELEKRYRNWFS
jgi:hypothetical protein